MPGVPTTNNSLEANNDFIKALLGESGMKKKKALLPALGSMLQTSKALSQRDSAQPGVDAMATAGLTANADRKYGFLSGFVRVLRLNHDKNPSHLFPFMYVLLSSNREHS
jgi:hypothetical protein